MMVCLAVATVLIVALGLSWRLENARRDQIYGPAALVLPNRPQKPSQGASVVVEDLTDVQNKAFRYVY